MAKCDLCDQSVSAHEIVQLLEQYQIPGVVDVCPKCCKWANKVKSDLLSEIGPKMRQAITERKGQATPEMPKSRRPMLPWKYFNKTGE